MGDLSLCGLAMLAVVVDRVDGIAFDELYKAVPSWHRLDELPGMIETWPHDAVEWIDEIQGLLDRGLVQRMALPSQYVYVPTRRGELVVRAALHPQGNTLESLA